jgi:hypothetical protein
MKYFRLFYVHIIYLFIYIFLVCATEVGRDGVLGIATRYGLDGPGIESQCGEILLTRPDRPWGPPGLLYVQCVPAVFPGGKAAGAWL